MKLLIETGDEETVHLLRLVVALLRRREDEALDRLGASLVGPTNTLAAAVDAAGGNSRSTAGDSGMAKKNIASAADAQAALDDLTAQVSKTRGVIASATTFVSGVRAMIDAAVQAAIGNGATAEQLAPVVAVADAMGTEADSLAAAVAANATP